MDNCVCFTAVKAVGGLRHLNFMKSGAFTGSASCVSEQGRSLMTGDTTKWK